ncbi:MAG: FAD:protein FMN transferase [Candidatus Rifleibacteriota bacterium]
MFNARRIEPVSEIRLMMDTMVTIKVYADKKKAEEAVAKGFEQFALVEKNVSFHKADSALSKLNEQRKIEAEGIIKQLLDTTTKYFKITDRYFDPTFARLQKAYGFYDKSGRLPDEMEIENLLDATGWTKKVFYNETSNEYSLASGALIDLGGIAGGYAIERAATAIKKTGCKDFLIDDGGDIWVEGDKPDNSAWTIAVRDPRDNKPLALVESLENIAVSTSGNYERFVIVDGQKYGHIMNPVTGKPADFYKSVTVVASSPVKADVFSTAFYAMPPQKAFTWAEAKNLAVLCLTSDDEIKMTKPGKKWFKILKN